MITPGGLVSATLPHAWRGGLSWDSTDRDYTALCEDAEEVLHRVLTKRVLHAARDKAQVLTVGIDLHDPESNAHAELVAIVNIDDEKVQWTGKSYPTTGQEKGLIQVANLGTHLVKIARERVLVLGCHDLNMFSARTLANCNRGSKRHRRCRDMVRLAKQFKPTVVLHHPHTTDTPRIWSTAWSGVQTTFPALKAWASGIRYFNRPKLRATMDKVLCRTRSESGVLDIIVKSR